MESALKSSYSMLLIDSCINTRKHLARVKKKSCANLTCAAAHEKEALLYLEMISERSQQSN